MGLVVFAASLGVELVDPTRYEWLMQGDRGVHHLGWHMYRASPWTLPLGTTTTMLWPVGSSVGLTDSIPIFAFVFKPLRALLPPDFQYIGLWLLLCFVLQGYFGALLVGVWSRSPWVQVCGAALLVMAPPLLARLMHAALSAHWLLLAALWLYWARPRATSRLWPWVLLVATASATHPYLAFMVLALVAAAHARDAVADRRLIGRATAHGVGLAIVAGVVLWQCGYFAVSGGDDLNDSGFGFYSMNLFAPIMPMEHSALGPGPFRYATEGQYEGYAYFGAGVLLLVVLAIVVVARRHWPFPFARARTHIPLLLVCTVFLLLALSPVLTAGDSIIARYEASWWGPLQVFRSSGRMFWPVYYLIVMAAIGIVAQLRLRVAVPLLLTAVSLQYFDIGPLWSRLRGERAMGFRHVLESPFWRRVPVQYDTLALVPTNLCSPVDYVDPREFLLLAGRLGVNVNAGMAARYDTSRAEAYCRAMREQLRGALRDDTLYIGDPRFVSELRDASERQPVCTTVDGFAVCTTADAYARWQDVYDVARRTLPPVEDFLAFYAVLQTEYAQRLDREPRPAAGTDRERVEAIADYLSYRSFGCEHQEALEYVRQRGTSGGAARVCAQFRPGVGLPSSGETYAFRQQIEAAFVGAVSQATPVDPEGEAVWLHRYTGERLRGSTHAEAQAIVLQHLRTAVR